MKNIINQRIELKRKLRNITNDAVKKLPLKFDYSYLVIAKETILKKELISNYLH